MDWHVKKQIKIRSFYYQHNNKIYKIKNLKDKIYKILKITW